ncbi:low molecular weight protein-tyrosine-phosphatase [Streptomyces tauricus]|uniref:low molecular weight protein-tyrosine-phosphatase n=1 Tax=Streptomyces tauricus TaxID=68274 RepID=UPI0022435B9A|nr:low molecular weight protein-tyrosine-phosphatase [Streptomyces tauricus]MCW8101729.1 low molecular weight phosphotyrosine protein phosphatase [Streptomyces tauricus]
MRILTVCLGNICRSPYAAAILTHHGGTTVLVRSAGLRDKWAGRPAHQEMLRLAATRGYDLTGHRATQVTPDLLVWADLVLAMDRAVLDELHAFHGPHTATLALYLGEGDVPDPYCGDEHAFRACADLIEAAAPQHVP